LLNLRERIRAGELKQHRNDNDLAQAELRQKRLRSHSIANATANTANAMINAMSTTGMAAVIVVLVVRDWTIVLLWKLSHFH
jgi:hypothetical protein